MDWARWIFVILLVSLTLPALANDARGQTELVETRLAEISDKITIKHPPSWTPSTVTYANARELVVTRTVRTPAREGEAEQAAETVDARMMIMSEPRKNHADALNRLSNLTAERRGNVRFLEIGGWPAVEISFVERSSVRGQLAAPTLYGHRAIIAVAAADRVVRFDVALASGAPLRLLEEAETIARSVAFPTRAAPAAVQRTLRDLERRLAQKRAAAAPPLPASAAAAAVVGTGATTAAGAPAVGVHAGFGEIEIVTSPDAMNIVLASNFKVAVSTDRGASFAPPANLGPFSNVPTDPTLTRGASGAFYLGTLARPNGSPEQLNQTGCTNAILRSTNGGSTFGLQGYSAHCDQSGAARCFADQPHIAAEPVATSGTGDQLYAVWRKLRPMGSNQPQCQNVIITDYRDPTISCSTDSGVTWRPEAQIVGAGDFPRVAVARDGTVFVVSLVGEQTVLLHRFSSCASGLTAMSGYPVTIPMSTSQVACPMPGLDRCNFGNTLSSPTVAPDPDDAAHLFVTFAELDGVSGERVVVAESRDSGATFPRRATVSGTPGARRYFPWACAARGDAWGGWYDRRAASQFGATNDLTDYFIGVARSLGGTSPSLTAGPERKLTTASDPQCASGWSVGGSRCVPREVQDSESCSVQPQQAGVCRVPPDGTTGSNQRCDFSNNNCPTGESCMTQGGCPKYGDYNGIACTWNWLVAGWASATPPTGVTAPPGMGIYASAEYIGPIVMGLCQRRPEVCVAPVALLKNALRVKCAVVPCIVVDPLPRNCTVKWSCPACPPGSRCGPYFHIVFDESLGPWKPGIVDGRGRLIGFEPRRVGRFTVLTLRPLESDLRDGEIADYRLVLMSTGSVTPGREYTIRARLETSASPVLDVARLGTR